MKINFKLLQKYSLNEFNFGSKPAKPPFSKIHSRFALLSLICLMLFALTACQVVKPKQNILDKVKASGKITAGVKFDSKPFGFIDKDQQLKGFDIDLIKEISKRILGSENIVDFQQVTSSNRIFSLTSGAVDLVAATMTINPQRSQIIDFSSPYYIAGQAIMVPKNSNIKSVKDLNGKKVLVVLGSTSEKNIRELAPQAIIQGFRTYTDAFSALRAGRGDALTTDDTIITGFIAEDQRFIMLKERYTKEPYGIGFKKGEDTKSFQRAVNIALEEISADGTLEKIRKKWLDGNKK